MLIGNKVWNKQDYAKLARIANGLRNLNFDPSFFHVLKTGSGIYISAKPTESGGNTFRHNFQTTYANAAGGTYYIADGTWIRNGDPATWTNVGEISPLGNGIIPEDYTGDVYNYVIRAKSYGGNQPLEILCSGVELPSAGYDCAYECEKLISVVSFTNGTADTIVQSVVGDIEDRIETGGLAGSEYDNFGLYLTKANVAGEFETGVVVGGGELRRRNNLEVVTGTFLDPVPNSKKVYLELCNLDTDPEKDPSLIPDGPSVRIEDNYPIYKDYSSEFIKLYELNYAEIPIDAAGGTSGLKYKLLTVKRMHEGTVIDDWVRADGVDTGWGTIDADYPRVKGLDFNTEDCAHEGVLQEYKAWNELTQTFFEDDDKVLSYYDINLSGDSTKYYMYIDANGYEAGHTCGESIEFLEYGGEKFLQLHGFKDCSPYATVTSNSELTSALHAILARNPVTNPTGELEYLDLSSCVWSSADRANSANSANYAASAGTAGSAGIVGWAETAGTAYTAYLSHNELEDIVAQNAGDDHNGYSGGGNYPYIGNTGDYSRNRMSDGLGDSGGGTSVCVNGRILHDNTYIKLDWYNGTCNDSTNNLSLDWQNRALHDTTAAKVLDWSLLQLIDAGSTLVSWDSANWFLDWDNYNEWSTSSFAYQVASSKLVSTGNMDVTAGSCFHATAQGSNDWRFGSWNILPYMPGNGTINIGDESNKWMYLYANIETCLGLNAHGSSYISIGSAADFYIRPETTGGNLYLGDPTNVWLGAITTANVITSSAGTSFIMDSANEMVHTIGTAHTVNGVAFTSIPSNINIIDDIGNLVPIEVVHGWMRKL